MYFMPDSNPETWSCYAKTIFSTFSRPQHHVVAMRFNARDGCLMIAFKSTNGANAFCDSLKDKWGATEILGSGPTSNATASETGNPESPKPIQAAAVVVLQPHQLRVALFVVLGLVLLPAL